MKHAFKLMIFGFALLILPVAAYSHTGIESLTQLAGLQAFVAGLLHPLLGLDHLLVMLAIGFWAALLRGKALWLLPGSFLLMMTLGAGLHLTGIQLATAEVWVSLSVLVCGLGLFWAHRQNMLSLLSALLTSVFAISHGYVHAAEAISDISSYAIGFMLTTAMLHGLGILLCSVSGSQLDTLRKSFAVICALTGAVLLIAM